MASSVALGFAAIARARRATRRGCGRSIIPTCRRRRCARCATALGTHAVAQPRFDGARRPSAADRARRCGRSSRRARRAEGGARSVLAAAGHDRRVEVDDRGVVRDVDTPADLRGLREARVASLVLARGLPAAPTPKSKAPGDPAPTSRDDRARAAPAPDRRAPGRHPRRRTSATSRPRSRPRMIDARDRRRADRRRSGRRLHRRRRSRGAPSRWPLRVEPGTPTDVRSKRLEIQLVADQVRRRGCPTRCRGGSTMCGRTAVIPLRITALYAHDGDRWVAGVRAPVVRRVPGRRRRRAATGSSQVRRSSIGDLADELSRALASLLAQLTRRRRARSEHLAEDDIRQCSDARARRPISTASGTAATVRDAQLSTACSLRGSPGRHGRPQLAARDDRVLGRQLHRRRRRATRAAPAARSGCAARSCSRSADSGKCTELRSTPPIATGLVQAT